MKQVDMSSEAVTRRLRQASELRDLSLSLMKAKKAHDEKMAKQLIEQTRKASLTSETKEEPIH